MSDKLEQEILEDINKILFKLSSLEDVKLVSNDNGTYFVPSTSDAEDADYDREEDDEENYLDKNGKLKTDVRFTGYYSDPVKFQEQYENFKLSTIKTLLAMLIINKKGKDSDRKLTDAQHILAQYYNSNC